MSQLMLILQSYTIINSPDGTTPLLSFDTIFSVIVGAILSLMIALGASYFIFLKENQVRKNETDDLIKIYFNRTRYELLTNREILKNIDDAFLWENNAVYRFESRTNFWNFINTIANSLSTSEYDRLINGSPNGHLNQRIIDDLYFSYDLLLAISNSLKQANSKHTLYSQSNGSNESVDKECFEIFSKNRDKVKNALNKLDSYIEDIRNTYGEKFNKYQF
jgi:hypothetical protein